MEPKPSQIDIFESFESKLKEGVFSLSADFKVLSANHSLVRMLGMNCLDDVRGKSVDDFLERSGRSPSIVEKLNEEGSLIGIRFLLKKKGAASFWAEIFAKKMATHNDVAYQGLVRDISERISFERQLNRSRLLLQKKDLEMRKFLYSASHDIRAPISSILGLLDLMRMEKSNDNYEGYIEMLDLCAKKADHFIRDVVRYSKNSIRRVADGRIDFANLIKSVIEDLTAEHPKAAFVFSNVTIQGDFAFYSDHEMVRLIISNIVKNSFDFADVTKTIPLVAVRITIFCDSVIIQIKDNGAGIDADAIPKVFDMFYRGSKSANGPGLGLYCVKALVSEMGGEVGIMSEINVGTTVELTIPNSVKGRLINQKIRIKNDLWFK